MDYIYFTRSLSSRSKFTKIIRETRLRYDGGLKKLARIVNRDGV